MTNSLTEGEDYLGVLALADMFAPVLVRHSGLHSTRTAMKCDACRGYIQAGDLFYFMDTRKLRFVFHAVDEDCAASYLREAREPTAYA